MALRVVEASDRGRLAAALRGSWMPAPELVHEVASILADVRMRGDAALVDYTLRFDNAAYDIAKLRVPIPMEEQARSLVPPEIAEGLRLAKERVVRFHERQRMAETNYADDDGTQYGVRLRAYRSVAAYVPGGMSPQPTGVVMTAAVAKIAGVDRVIVLTPPRRDGHVDSSILFACSLCRVDELYAIGGAQAIAAAAFGTESVAPVDKIVGGGGSRVIEAKRQVYGVCAIDGLRGFPDVLVVADDGASSEYIVAELLAQAEQKITTRVAVVSESLPLLEAVAQLLDTLDVKTLPHGEIVSHVIAHACYLVRASGRSELLELVESFAPGNLCLHVRDPEAYIERLCSVGIVFVGEMTPLASGAYLAGPSRVVPGSGTARFESALGLADFQRRFAVVENSRVRMTQDAQAMAALADLEDRPGHAQSARVRSEAASLREAGSLPTE
jgi:histidinol dehydrogenase